MSVFVKEGTEEIAFFVHLLIFPQEYNKLTLVIFIKDAKKLGFLSDYSMFSCNVFNYLTHE